jgi:hypothetical protein
MPRGRCERKAVNITQAMKLASSRPASTIDVAIEPPCTRRRT